jgi:hypothetical protein
VALERDGYVFFPHMLSKEEIRAQRQHGPVGS